MCRAVQQKFIVFHRSVQICLQNPPRSGTIFEIMAEYPTAARGTVGMLTWRLREETDGLSQN
jgi:hypothetical protein